MNKSDDVHTLRYSAKICPQNLTTYECMIDASLQIFRKISEKLAKACVFAVLFQKWFMKIGFQEKKYCQKIL
jgi:hypothetical protein